MVPPSLGHRLTVPARPRPPARQRPIRSPISTRRRLLKARLPSPRNQNLRKRVSRTANPDRIGRAARAARPFS
jgi:hypothetical protein